MNSTNYILIYSTWNSTIRFNIRGFAKFETFESDSLSKCSNLKIKTMFLFRKTGYKVTNSLLGNMYWEHIWDVILLKKHILFHFKLFIYTFPVLHGTGCQIQMFQILQNLDFYLKGFVSALKHVVTSVVLRGV